MATKAKKKATGRPRAKGTLTGGYMRFNVLLDSDVAAKLQAMAEKEDRTISYMIRAACTAYAS